MFLCKSYLLLEKATEYHCQRDTLTVCFSRFCGQCWQNFLMSHFNTQQVFVLFLETFLKITKSVYGFVGSLSIRQEYESWINLESKYG